MLLMASATMFAQTDNPVPRRSAAEQEAFEKTVPVNPARLNVVTITDCDRNPVISDQITTNWKPVINTAITDKDPQKDPAGDITLPVQQDQLSTNIQPSAALPAGSTTNYRNITGSSSQPDAQPSGNTVNYRNLKPTDNQPAGKKPETK